MKHSKRNLLIALGLAASLVAPGIAMADNGHKYSLKHSIKQQQEARHEHRHDRRLAQRDRHDRHQWREHQRRDRFERNTEYRRYQWREHERQYRYLHRHGYYGVYPSAYRSGIVVLPFPRLVIDLH